MAGGRPRGSTNHQSAAIKDMIRMALDKVGGLDYFVRQAKENPTAFMSLIGKTIPSDVQMTVVKTAWEQIEEVEGQTIEALEYANGNAAAAEV